MVALLRKEVWPMLLPAAAVAAAVLVGMIVAGAQQTLQLQYLVFMVGSSYVAAVPFGYEFQQRTLGLFLSQPAPRFVLWRHKMLVMAATVLGLGILCYSTWPSRSVYVGDREMFLEVMMSMAITVCSACYWTLVARSIIGGAVFTVAGQVLVVLFASGVRAILAKGFGTESRVALVADNMGMHISVAVYCIGLVWLGWRKFSRFEVADTAMASGARIRKPTVDRAAPRMLQAARGAPTWNLFRKELFLHKAAYALTILFTGCWAAAYGVRWLAPERVSDEFFVAIGFALTVIAGLLAGSLSLAEENTIGTAEWHRVLPVSWKRQWAVKAGVSAFITLLVGVALPFVLTTLAVDFNQAEGKGMTAGQMLLAMTLVALPMMAVGMWASAQVSSTVRAAALATLMTIVLILLFMLAGTVARETRVGRELEEVWSATLVVMANRLRLPTSGLWQIMAKGPLVGVCIGFVCCAALAQSWSFYRPSKRAWPGLTVILLLFAGGFGLWTADWWGWVNASGCLALVALLRFLIGKRRWMRPRRALLPWFTAIVLAAIAFMCWLALLTLTNALTSLSSGPPPAGL